MSSGSGSLSRKIRIPPNYISKWQGHEPRGSKGHVRRPMIACRACRTAKAKCNGKWECERCVNRGLVCSHARTDAAVRSSTKPPSSLPSLAPTDERAELSESQQLLVTQSSPSHFNIDSVADLLHHGRTVNSTGASTLETSALESKAHNAGVEWPTDPAPPRQPDVFQTMTEEGEYNVDLFRISPYFGAREI